MKTLLGPVWNGSELRETVEHGGKKFRIVTGLRNGGQSNYVDLITDIGLKFLIGDSDVKFFNFKGVSYVSDEKNRKLYAKDMNKTFKEAIKKLYKE